MNGTRVGWSGCEQQSALERTRICYHFGSASEQQNRSARIGPQLRRTEVTWRPQGAIETRTWENDMPNRRGANRKSTYQQQESRRVLKIHVDAASAKRPRWVYKRIHNSKSMKTRVSCSVVCDKDIAFKRTNAHERTGCCGCSSHVSRAKAHDTRLDSKARRWRVRGEEVSN